MTCPVCESRDTGRVGTKQYYCRDCCVEFVVRRDRIQVFQLEDDGSIVALKEMGLLS